MLYKIPDVTGDLVLSKGEHAYREIVDAIPTAQAVTVLTYNLSKKYSKLLDVLKQCPAEVRLITHIPSRFNSYGGPTYRQTAAKAITAYLKMLDPNTFGLQARVCFCFSNHCKIIMTESIGYVGSANYSEESATNWEAGIIVRDPAVLAKLADYVGEIEADSIRYYGAEMLNAVRPLLQARQEFMDLAERLYGSFYDDEIASEIGTAVKNLRDVIAEWDKAWGDEFAECGPLYSRIDSNLLAYSEAWFHESLAVDGWREATEKYKKALAGDIDSGELPTNNDGVILDEAYSDVVDDLYLRMEEGAVGVENELPSLCEAIEKACDHITNVCRDIARHLEEIDNT
jgi:hypothetical protein